MTLVRQIICTLIVCYSILDLGIMYSWPSSTIQRFSSTNTTLDRPMSDIEQALFGSLFSVTAIISNPLSGFSMDLIGRKKSCILFTLTQVIAWAIISVCRQVEVVLIAVCISGLGAGLMAIVPLYISEICQETVRGTLVAGFNMSIGLGTVVSYFLGGYLSYSMMAYSNLLISIIAVIMLIYMKESPVFLMNRNLEKEAAESVAFYRSSEPNSKEVFLEICAFRRAKNQHSDYVLPEEEALNRNVEQKKLSFFQFFPESNLASYLVNAIIGKSKSTQRAFTFGCILALLDLSQGLVIVQVYAQPLFDEAMPSISGNTTSIVFGLVCCLFNFVSAFLVELFGRRVLTIYPSIATSLCCVVLGTQVQWRWGPSWITGIFLYLYAITYNVGIGTCLYVFIAEVFLPEVSSIMIMLIFQFSWMCTFLALFAVQPLVSLVGIAPLFYIFSAGSFITVIFAAFCLPETKGLKVDVIQTLLVPRRRN